MRRRRQQRLAERMRREALDSGQLRDVSADARQYGIDVPVAVSQAVWTSLMRAYPGVQSADVVSLGRLLEDLRLILELPTTQRAVQLYTPTIVPNWLSVLFTLRLRFNYSGERLVAILVCSDREFFAYKVDDSPDLLPAALLVRLHRLVLDLSLVRRTAESKLVERMWCMSKVLLRSQPARHDLEFWLSGRKPTLPPSFTREEFRVVVLRSLAELLVTMEACGSQGNYVAKLVSYHEAMISPLCELAEVTERLLKLAARLPNEAGPLEVGPFRHLLAAFHAMQSALDCGSSAIYASVLVSVRGQLHGLRGKLGNRAEAELGQLQEWFKRLDQQSPLGSVVDFRYLQEEAIVWQ